MITLDSTIIFHLTGGFLLIFNGFRQRASCHFSPSTSNRMGGRWARCERSLLLKMSAYARHNSLILPRNCGVPSIVILSIISAPDRCRLSQGASYPASGGMKSQSGSGLRSCSFLYSTFVLLDNGHKVLAVTTGGLLGTPFSLYVCGPSRVTLCFHFARAKRN